MNYKFIYDEVNMPGMYWLSYIDFYVWNELKLYVIVKVWHRDKEYNPRHRMTGDFLIKVIV